MNVLRSQRLVWRDNLDPKVLFTVVGRHADTIHCHTTGRSTFHLRIQFSHWQIFILRCIIQLGTTGRVSGFDIDTANFNGVLTHRYLLKSHSPPGNEAPEASVYGLYDAELKDPRNDDPRVWSQKLLLGSFLMGGFKWSEILPKVGLGPSTRHLFKIPETPPYNYVKIHMYPDGGIVSSDLE